MSSTNPKKIAAVVFLHSVSGKSVRGLSHGPLPSDLTPYRASAHNRDRLRRVLVQRGFEVFSNSLELTFSIQGPPSLFASYFGVSEQLLEGIAGNTVPELASPEEIRALVEAIVMLSPPLMVD